MAKGGEIKMEEIKIRESYKEHLKSLKDISTQEYLHEGFRLDEDSILKAIDYYKICIPKELKEILLTSEYWTLYYNSNKTEYLIKTLGLTHENDKKAIGTFVYTFNNDEREFNEAEDEQNLREDCIKNGYKEQDIKDIEGLRLLDGLKVSCVFDRDRIGLMGSFTEKETKKGSLVFIENSKTVAFMPPRHTKTGQLLINNFYYKEIK